VTPSQSGSGGRADIGRVERSMIATVPASPRHRGILSAAIGASQQSEPVAAHFGHVWKRAFPHAIGCTFGKKTTAKGERNMPAQRAILIVEDDEAIRNALAEQLADDHGFAVTAVATLDAAGKAFNDQDGHFHAVILDIGMPDGDGCHFCARIRRQGHTMPIIMLTGSAGEADVVRGLESGANDYIAKPFRANELLARLRTQLRLFESSEDAVFAVGPYTFRPSKRILVEPNNNRRIRLTDKEAAILKFLYRSDSRAVDRQVLLHEVWGYNPSVTTHTLETHIYRLRQKMESQPRNPVLLVTENGGYRLSPAGAH
jgi:DNA-binding response OmpR family regulator